MTKYLIGIDEAGRGPLAGPVTVGVVSVPIDFDWSLLPGVGDSKQTSPAKRELIFKQATHLREEGELNFQVVSSSHLIIDDKGIVFAIKRAMKRGLEKLQLDPRYCQVLLDGSLRAPSEFINQQTIIKGDATEPAIGLASILAKVTRDRFMTKIAQNPELLPYDLASHKGYGTKKHCESIRQYGLSNIHRKTFCTNLLK
ncbi:ribonuclease HII [Candidatus Nomurabacteria bacterium]|nr:ribonuclease HII [Candidatus Nomurabacteria bacterium]